MKSFDIKKKAYELGFAKVFILKPVRTERPSVSRYNERVIDDPFTVMPEAKSLIALLKSYVPYEENPLDVRVSAYYPASNEAYHAAKALADVIEKEGFRAIANVQIALKPVLLNAFIGKAGKNSLVSVEGLGTRFHVQTVLTDAPFERDVLTEKTKVSEMCVDCGLCVRACPSGAIGENGFVNAERCLRSKDDGETVPASLREKYKNMLLGCDICQDVCPRNADEKRLCVPEELREALSLEKLLTGKVRELSAFLGRNYARKSRIRMKAALVAANMKRRDMEPLLEEMIRTGTEGEKEHALWALETLNRKALKEEDK